jgi:hypothetical protein
MNDPIELTAHAPQLMVSRDGSQIIIRCQQVEQTAEGPKLNGEYIHLGMTWADGVRLLALLLEAQKQAGQPQPTAQVSVTDVPPVRSRN